jgi:hypothetical protein
METDSTRIRAPYVALSHCWGTNPEFLVLNASNLAQFRLGMRLDNLPQNFRDSCQIVLGLGLRYLWIDSLCILQSGPGAREDWKFHANKMASIYSNCFVSIATHHATSPNMSCFGERNQHFFEDFEDSFISWHGFKIGEAPYYVFDWNISGHGALRSSRLSTRAWVIQERLLSP